MKLRLLILNLLIFTIFPLTAEEFSHDTIKEAGAYTEKMKEFYGEGKTVKAEREAENAKQILRKKIKKGKKYSIPEACTFAHDQYMVNFKFECEELKDITFYWEKPEKGVLELLEECKESCAGDFLFVPLNQFKPDELFLVDQFQGIMLKIKVVKAKIGKKAKLAEP